MKPDTQARHDRAVEVAVHAMRATPSAEWDIDTLATMVGMSPHHFVHVFTGRTAVSPHRFLAALRMDCAKRMLLDTPASITSVCLSTGYNSIGTFTRTFTELVGVTPSRYRSLREPGCSVKFEAKLVDFVQLQLTERGDGAGLSGTISVVDPAHLERFSCGFLGVFDSQVPQGRPLCGTAVSTLGRFEFRAAAGYAGRYIHAVAFLATERPNDWLVPAADALIVASLALPARASESPLHLKLRPPNALDPPIVLALPALLLT